MSENKTSKPALPAGRYFKYAIGEIILVVIGILIALQINNWNENRKIKISEKAKLTKLLDDLKQDSITFDRSLKILDSINNLHKELYAIGYKGKDIDLTENPNLIRKHLFYNPVSEKNVTLLVTQLSNEPIRNQLTYYLDRLERNTIVNNEFSEIVKDKIRVLLTNNVAYNLQSQFEEKGKTTLNMISNDDIISLSKTTNFQQLLFNANFKLKELESGLNALISENSAIQNVIRNELKIYYD